MSCGFSCGCLKVTGVRLWNGLIRMFLSRFGELILTIGDFFGILVCVSAIFHVYVCLATLSIYWLVVTCFFSCISANVLLIPLWHFIRFSYFRDRIFPWKCLYKVILGPRSWSSNHDRALHWWHRDGIYTRKDELTERQNDPLLSDSEEDGRFQESSGDGGIELGDAAGGGDPANKPTEVCSAKWCIRQIWPALESILAIVFFVAAYKTYGGNGSAFLDWLCVILILVLPLAKIALLYLFYLANFWWSFHRRSREEFQKRKDKIRDPFIFSLFEHGRLLGGKCACSSAAESSSMSNSGIQETGGNTSSKKVRAVDVVWEIIHIVVPVWVLISYCVTFRNQRIALPWVCLVVIVVVFFPLFQIRFPFFVLGYFASCFCTRDASELKDQKDFTAEMLLSRSPRMKWIRVLSPIVFLIVLVAMVCIYQKTPFTAITREYTDFSINSDYQYMGQPDDPTVNNTKEIVSEMCYVKPYKLKIIQMAVLAAASYNDLELDGTKAFIKEFFDDTYRAEWSITASGQMNLTEYEVGAAAFFNFEYLNLTVVSVRGSTEARDWQLDGQFFLSSALLTLAAPLALFTASVTKKTNYGIKSILGWPLYALKPISLTEKYVTTINRWYETVPKLGNVLFVGHSLGGGLAKLFGHMHGKPSISVSGPGISVAQTLYPPPDGRKDLERILTGETEVVPDSDITPRIEVSAGTRYRVMCGDGGSCHSVVRTICMIGIMCETEHRDFCESILDPKLEYDKMVHFARNT